MTWLAAVHCQVQIVDSDGIQPSQEAIVLIALRDIHEGEVLSVAPEAGGEYDEWELDLVTGDFVKVPAEDKGEA